MDLFHIDNLQAHLFLNATFAAQQFAFRLPSGKDEKASKDVGLTPSKTNMDARNHGFLK